MERTYSEVESMPQMTDSGEEIAPIPFSTLHVALKHYHETDIYGGRYDFARRTRAALDAWVANASTGSRSEVDEFCTVEFVGALIEVILDPTIYTWYLGESSEHYHPRLEEYTTNMHYMLSSCCTQMIYTDPAFFEERSAEVARRLLRLIPPLWSLLWTHRAAIVSSKQMVVVERRDSFVGAMVEVIARVIDVHSHIHGQHSRPALSSEMAELLIYSWPYQSSSALRSFSAKVVVTLSAGRAQATQGEEWFKAVIRKVITDRDIALRIVETLCRDIRSNDWIIDEPRFFVLALVEKLVRLSPLVREVGVQHPKENLIRSLAIAGQRQLCLGSENSESSPSRDPEFLGIRKMLLTSIIVISANVEGMGLDGSTPIFDPDSIGIWTRVCASTFMRAVAAEADNFDTCVSIQTLFALYAKRFNSGSSSKKIADLRRTFQYTWFSIMKDLKSLRLRPSDKLHPFFVAWKVVGRQLGIPSNAQQPQDPAEIGANHVVCCWAECLCHWANPCRHKLRICKGCYLVMYCGKRCQELDWTKGGHRGRCAGRKGTGS